MAIKGEDTAMSQFDYAGPLSEIVRLRDEKGMTWQEVSDSIEKRLCEYEGREFS